MRVAQRSPIPFGSLSAIELEREAQKLRGLTFNMPVVIGFASNGTMIQAK